MWLVIILVPALVTAVLIAVARRSRLARVFADVPNERSLHGAPTPRLGGIVLVASMLPFAAWHADAPLATVLGCAAFLALLSLGDDYRSLPIEVRLPAHFAAALVVVLAGTRAGFSPAGVVEATLAVLAIVWMTNAFNFMDGADGLAGGMGLFGFATLGVGAVLAGDTSIAVACAAIASAACGFLLHNFPPARVFLGDAGSVPLGFLAGALGWLGFTDGIWPAWFPVLAFAPFLVDATLTLVRRIARRERFWKAHRSHAYQRLVLEGWSRTRLALSAYALMAFSGLAAVLALGCGAMGRAGILAGCVVVYVAIFTAIGFHLRQTTKRD
jgi:UDP-N-acetylmuramyl pentapeptide phosphotransferase/UDP-N-acetylglucosamine-1-phosphate transferase